MERVLRHAILRSCECLYQLEIFKAHSNKDLTQSKLRKISQLKYIQGVREKTVRYELLKNIILIHATARR